jgi:hypothetical protein
VISSAVKCEIFPGRRQKFPLRAQAWLAALFSDDTRAVPSETPRPQCLLIA